MHVVVNAAMSADGKLSSRRRDQVRISGPEDFARVDGTRADCDAVAVGIGTVLADDPHLTVEDPDLRAERRERGDPEHPARVVIDTRARTPTDARVLDDESETYLLIGEDAPDDRRAALRGAGVRIVEAGTERVDLATGLDELSVYVGSLLIGGRDAPTLADGEGFVETFPELALESVERIDDGVLLSYTFA